MKFVRFGGRGQERPGCLGPDGVLRDLSAITPDFERDAVSCEALSALAARDLTSLPAVPDGTRLGCVLADALNFFCVGLNYVKHAEETGAVPPKEPVLFSKATSTLHGPFDEVLIPRGGTSTDWEVELGIVIGKGGSYISQSDALSHIAGYCIVNDVSERVFQRERGGQWIKGKSAPTFGPCGPYLVTPDEIPNVQSLQLTTKVNGELRQNSNTDDMIFPVVEIVSYISQFMELRVGDLIATGTPSGVGMGYTPPQFLKPGDVMELEIEGLGHQRLPVGAA
ncbi:fumarylacetoacetate hydrolase family protein [Halovulum sp. GXIMD14793]